MRSDTQGFYVNARVTSDWRPGETRIYYLYSPFAQGVNSGAQVGWPGKDCAGCWAGALLAGM